MCSACSACVRDLAEHNRNSKSSGAPRITLEMSHLLESLPLGELKSKMVKKEHELSRQHQRRFCKVAPSTEPEASVLSRCQEKELRACQARERKEQSRATRRATRRSLFLGQLVLACSFRSVVSTDCSRCAHLGLGQWNAELENTEDLRFLSFLFPTERASSSTGQA